MLGCMCMVHSMHVMWRSDFVASSLTAGVLTANKPTQATLLHKQRSGSQSGARH
jgi:hypothetical protein